MRKNNCECCGVEVNSWTEKWKAYNTEYSCVFCGKCENTEAANKIVETKKQSFLAGKPIIAEKPILADESSPVGIKANISQDINKIVVTDVDMPFGKMVRLMVKWAVASIPAGIILFVVFNFFPLLFLSLFNL